MVRLSTKLWHKLGRRREKRKWGKGKLDMLQGMREDFWHIEKVGPDLRPILLGTGKRNRAHTESEVF